MHHKIEIVRALVRAHCYHRLSVVFIVLIVLFGLETVVLNLGRKLALPEEPAGSTAQFTCQEMKIIFPFLGSAVLLLDHA